MSNVAKPLSGRVPIQLREVVVFVFVLLALSHAPLVGQEMNFHAGSASRAVGIAKTDSSPVFDGKDVVNASAGTTGEMAAAAPPTSDDRMLMGIAWHDLRATVESHYSRAESLMSSAISSAGLSHGPLEGIVSVSPEKSWSNLILLQNPQIDAWERYFSGPGRGRLIAALKRLGPHRELAETILAGWDVPQELVVVAFVESEFVSDAVSPKGATGPWQFMPVTASRYGLRAATQKDDRKDFQKSTYAAAVYLRDLRDLFGGWLLALAAYNAGEERVSDAIRRGKTRDFWKLSERGLLPEETQSYVPKVLGALRVWKEVVAPQQLSVAMAGKGAIPGTRSNDWVYALTSEESSFDRNQGE